MVFIVKVPGVNSINGISDGCERAGNSIIAKLDEIKINEQGKLIDKRLFDFEEIHLDNKNLELTNKLIFENSLEIFESKDKTIFLGGDNSISFSICRAFLDNCIKSNKIPCLVIFDSRANCKGVHGGKYPNNENWLRMLIENGFPNDNIIIIGFRESTNEEMEFLKKNNILRINVNSCIEDLDNITDTIMEFCNGKNIYISIDLSVIDNAFCPAATFNDSAGLSSRELIYMLQRINKIKNIKGIDIVELNLKKEKSESCVNLAAKILGEIL